MIGPNGDDGADEGIRYQVKERLRSNGGSEWVLEVVKVSMAPTQMALIRLLVAKIEKPDAMAQLLRSIPIREGQAGCKCVLWVKEALSHLKASTGTIGTSVVDWVTVRDSAMAYCKQKHDLHRFDGMGKFDMSRVPTFDLIRNKEAIT